MTTKADRAALLAFRRKLTAAATAKRTRSRVPPAPLPSAPLHTYVRFLRELSDDLDAEIVDTLRDEGLVPRTDAAEGDVPSFNAASTAARVERIVARVLKKRPVLARLQEVADAVAGASRAAWARQIKAATGVDLAAAEPELGPLFKRFRKENTDLITSLGTEKVDRVRKVLDEAGSGTRVEEIAKALRETTGATRSRAELIARDQVLKLNAQVAQARHEAAGVTEFVWSTSRDERVREDHKKLDGKRFRYDDPPIVDRRRGDRALPGVYFQCRCVAIPVIPGFDDAKTDHADRTDAGDWKEGEHPRDKGGRFTGAGTGGRGPTRAKPPKDEGRGRGTETTGPRRGGIPSETIKRVATEHNVPPEVVEEFANSRARPTEAHVALVAKEGGADGVRLAAKLAAEGAKADKATEVAIAVSRVPGGHARTERLVATGQGHREAAHLATDAHKQNLSAHLDGALDDISRGRVNVTGNAAGAHEFIQAVAYLKNHGGGALHLDDTKTAVEGFREEEKPDGTRTHVYVSLKCHTTLKKVGNLGYKIMEDERNIRGFDRGEKAKPEGDRHPPLVGHTELHMGVNFSEAEVRGFIGDEPRNEEARAHFMRHIVPSPDPVAPRPCYKEITLVCTDVDLVLKPDGSITRREKSRL